MIVVFLKVVDSAWWGLYGDFSQFPVIRIVIAWCTFMVLEAGRGKKGIHAPNVLEK